MNLSYETFQRGRKVAAIKIDDHMVGFYDLLTAAILRADNDNLTALRFCFADVVDAVITRMKARGNCVTVAELQRYHDVNGEDAEYIMSCQPEIVAVTNGGQS